MNSMRRFLKINTVIVSILFMMCSCSKDDSGNSEPVNDTSLIGSWVFKENRNTSIPRTVDAPSDEDPVFIRFLGDEFQGETAQNEFSGTYATDSNSLILYSFNTTAVEDTAWGNQFFFALNQGYDSNENIISLDYEVSGTTLLIQYDTDSYLYFEKQ